MFSWSLTGDGVDWLCGAVSGKEESDNDWCISILADAGLVDFDPRFSYHKRFPPWSRGC